MVIKWKKKEVTLHAVHEHDLVEFLKSAGLGEEVKKNSFICAGCGRTMTIDDIVSIVGKHPKSLVYGHECYLKAGK